MVKIMENPLKVDDLRGPPLFLETPILTWFQAIHAESHWRKALNATARAAFKLAEIVVSGEKKMCKLMQELLGV